MELLITFFQSYLLAPLLIIILLLVMGSLKGLKEQLSMKYALLYILIAGLLLGTPGFLSVLQDEYVWGGIFISVGTYFILGLLALLTMKGGVEKSLGVSDKPFGQACILLASTILGAWIHYLLFTKFGGLPYGHIAMMQSLWFLIPFLTEFSLSRFHLVPPPMYELWYTGNSTFNRNYWDTVDSYKTIAVRVKLKRKLGDKEYSSFVVRLQDEISLGDWFNWLVEDQNKRSPEQSIVVGEEEVDAGWIFYTSRWITYPLFIRVLNPKLNRVANKIRKNQTIYIKRVIVVNERQYEEE